ncbi:MAG: OmpA family protein [Rhodocyclaceae bacterium]|nr:OmpA family protein [Rhodocyclaceae bacterium]
MINKFAKKTVLLALAAGLTMGATLAQAQERVYALDTNGAVAKSGFGLCWRTGYWTPAAAAKDAAGCQCDKDLLPKEVCEPKKPESRALPPEKKVTIAGEKITLAADALFDFDKAVLRPEGKAKLDDVVAKAKSLNLEVILAVGHTDRIGKEAYNQKLSEKRAAAVKSYLVSKGIEANRVYTEGKGEKQPVTGDKCKKMGAESGKNKKLVACLQPDRRVDVEVIGTK